MGLPLKRSSPPVGSSSLRSIFASTVLPQPDCPTSEMISRSLILKVTWSTAVELLPVAEDAGEVALRICMGLSRHSGTSPRDLCTMRSSLRRGVQSGCTMGQRSAKRQPGITRSSLGGAPSMAIGLRLFWPGSADSIEPMSAREYGWRPSKITCWVVPYSTNSPAYMTAIELATCRRSGSSCVMKSMLEMISCSRRSKSSLITDFCVETSSAEVGSSATTTFGFRSVEMPITQRCLVPAGSSTG